jgi:uncharacterized protein YbbC (DUF1343 family)
VRVRSGLDRVSEGEPAAVALLAGRRIGLVAHPASVDRRLRHAREVLTAAGARIVALFGPEHGYAGQAQDMIGVGGEGGAEGVRIHSLYGESEADLRPTPEMLEGLDAIVIDLQDVGSRYYTFVWTAALVLEAAAARGLTTIVLDRPNPIGGDVVEGAPQRPGYRSFVGLYDVPVRHGMTLAEIVRLVANELGTPDEALEVLPMVGYTRSMRWEDTGLPWVLPSPNMPTPDTARVYPGGCLIEGTTLSEGRGTTRPFEMWGGPAIDGEALARSVQITGAVLRPISFRPTFQKHAGRDCGGVQVHVVDERAFRPYEAYLRLVAAALVQLDGDEPGWRTAEYEYVTDRPAIDLLTGGPEFRGLVDAARVGAALDLDAYMAAQEEGAARFLASRRPFLLYGD